MVGPRPCPHPLQALQVSPGPAPPAVPSPWGQAAPSLAHTASLLLPLRHMMHSQVKPLQWKCSNRKFTRLVALPLGSFPCASARPSSACQQRSPPCTVQSLCCRMCATAWGFAGLPLLGEMWIPQRCSALPLPRAYTYHSIPIATVEGNSSFQVPGGQTWPLRKLCAQEAQLSSLPGAETFLPWPAALLLPAFPATGNANIF